MSGRLAALSSFFRHDSPANSLRNQAVDPAILQWNLLLLCMAIFTASFNILPGILLPTILGIVALVIQVAWALSRGREVIYPIYGVRRLFLAFMVLSWIYALIIGVDILNPSLYRREFKYFFSYSWFFLFSLLYYPREDSSESIHSALNLAAVFSVGWFIVGLVNPTFLSNLYSVTKTGMWERLGGPNGELIYSGPFLSHSSAGGFYAVLAVLLVSFSTRKPRYAALGLSYLLLGLLVFSAARAWLVAVIGLGVLMVLNYAIKRRSLSAVYLFAALGLVAISMLGVFHSSWIHPTRHGAHGPTTYATPEIHNEDKQETRVANISLRIRLWTIAIRDFVQSPFVGIGASRFDDNKYVMTRMTPGNPNIFGYISAGTERYLEFPFFHINVGSFLAHTDQHAHNVYFNVLAEGGMVFFALFAVMFLKLYRVIAQIAKKTEDPAKADLANGVNRSLLVVALASFFGNNLQGIIPMIMVLALAGFLLAPRQDMPSILPR